MSKLYVKDVLRVAADEVGYMEKASNRDLDSKTANAGAGNWTKYSRDLWNANPHFYQGPKQGYEWCCVFVDWCLYMASGKDASRTQNAKFYTGPYGAGVEFAAQYYKAAGAWFSTPQPGDQIFFGRNYEHTGLVERVADGKVYTIEGNYSNSVARRSYSLSDSYIVGYGRPNYDGDKKPQECPFVDVPSGSWYFNAVCWGYEHGLTVGTDPTHFSPAKPITRAEVMQMLYKAHQGG